MLSSMINSLSKHPDLQFVAQLLAEGADPSCADYDKRTPLMVSAQDGRTGVVKQLLDAGGDVHAIDVFGTNALFGAIKNGHLETANVLVAGGAK
jgi:ankyrin repeat protein